MEATHEHSASTERLEEAGGNFRPMIWRNHYETPEETKARWCTENGEDPAVEVVVIGWLDPQPNLPDQPELPSQEATMAACIDARAVFLPVESG
jgi:hypothetical protein